MNSSRVLKASGELRQLRGPGRRVAIAPLLYLSIGRYTSLLTPMVIVVASFVLSRTTIILVLASRKKTQVSRHVLSFSPVTHTSVPRSGRRSRGGDVIYIHVPKHVRCAN